MVTVNPQSITVTQAGSSGGGGGTSGCPQQGQYITINGKSYSYSYSGTKPSGYNTQVATPNFCIYYDGTDATAGCYCNTSNQIYGAGTGFYTNNNGGWWAIVTLKPSYYQFSIAWTEL